MTRPTTPDAAAPDVLAAEYDPAPDLRRVFAMHSASPPEGSDDGDRSPAINRVVASLAGGYCSTNLDVRDVRCLVVAFADAEGIIDALNSQLASARADLARLRAPSADVAAIGARAATTAEVLDALRAEAREHGDDSYGYGLCRVLSVLPRGVDPDVTTLLALLAAERERHAAEVAGARAAALREAEDACRAEAARWESDARAGGVLASERRATARELADAVAALATKGAPDV